MNISVGYRVKSQRGVQFRQWATQILKQHLIQGYTLNRKRLAQLGADVDQLIEKAHAYWADYNKRKRKGAS